ncbi:MAG: hypothetical protein ACP5M7_10460 [Thermoproteota archaeon]
MTFDDSELDYILKVLEKARSYNILNFIEYLVLKNSIIDAKQNYDYVLSRIKVIEKQIIEYEKANRK